MKGDFWILCELRVLGGRKFHELVLSTIFNGRIHTRGLG
jgi:hypothetical protein